MPSVSINEQQAAGIALACKRGEIPVSKLRGAARQMYYNMTIEELEEYARTKHKGLPEKKR